MNRREELVRAREIAEEAYTNLEGAQDELESAMNWGVADMVAHGTGTTHIKRNKVKKAEQKIEEAKASLQKLETEVKGASAIADLDLGVDGFLKFWDYFSRSWAVDYLVQDKIRDARTQVYRAMQEVKDVIRKIDRYL